MPGVHLGWRRPTPRQSAVAAALAIAVAGGTQLANAQGEPAPAAQRNCPAREYTIVNAASGKALDVQRTSAVNGAPPRQGSDTRRYWTLRPQADGSYEIADANSGKVLDVRHRSQTGSTQSRV